MDTCSKYTNNKWIINVFLESLLSASFPSLGVAVHQTSLGCPPTRGWSLDLLWGSLDSNLVLFLCSYLQYPQLSELVHFLLWELSLSFYIFHRHRVYILDCVDLICSLYSWWEGCEFSFLATLPLGFNCRFISHSACESSTGVCSWACPGGLGSALVKTKCGGGAAAWVTGLAAPDTLGSLQLGHLEIGCSIRAWQ